MSDRPAREWRFYLDDMIGFAEKVITYTADMDQAAFVASGLNYDATLRNLDALIHQLEVQLQQQVEERTLFPVEWELK